MIPRMVVLLIAHAVILTVNFGDGHGSYGRGFGGPSHRSMDHSSDQRAPTIAPATAPMSPMVTTSCRTSAHVSRGS